MSALLDGVSAVAILGEDATATAAVAMGVARVQAMHRRVFVGDLLGDASPLARENPMTDLGLSDMMRYGVSLGKVAMADPASPNLFTVAGGAETPLAEDILTSTGWRSLSDQVHRAGALLVLAAPARQPELEHAARQLDGVLLVDEARSPGQGIRVLGDVQIATTMPTLAAARAVPAPAPAEQRPARWLLWFGGALLLLLVALMVVPVTRERLLGLIGMGGGPDSAVAVVPSGGLPDVPLPPARPASDAAWSVELLFSNSEVDALARAAGLADSVPATTFSAPVVGADSTTWQRLVGGAFSDSLSAENFLASLRTRGHVAPDGGVVLYTPFAFLLDSAQDGTLAAVRVTAYRGRGIPAYALRDSVGWWRVYAGAFGSLGDASHLRQRLDSLNIQSTLLTRVGSEQ
jgi:hypothetical protein